MASEAAQLAQLLLAAASGDGRVRGPAQEKLQELESRPGFVPVLLAAYADANIEAQGRYLAVLMCKNVIERQWQPRSGTSIGASEKTAVKDQLLRLVKAATEGGLPHLVELTLVLRRVCRFDFPMHWEALTRFLVEELQAQRQRGFSESALAVVLVLHQVLKEQSTKRLMSSRREFHHVGKELIEAVGAVWALKMEHLKQLQHQGSMVDDRFWRLSRDLDGSFLLLLVHGVPHVHEHPTGPQMIQMVKDQVETLLVLLQTHSQQLIQCPFFLKNLKSVFKWWALLFHAHPLAFAAANVNAVLHCSVEVLRTLTGLNVSPEMRPWLEGLLRSQLLMLSHSFNTVTFRKGPQPNHQGAALEAARLCHSQFGDFLRAHSVADLCELACRAALRLPQEEVQTWLSEPEDQLLGPQCQTELHQAGEACIKALGQAPLDQALVEHIAKRMQEETASAPSPNDSFDVVMRKDMLLSLLAFCHSQLTPHLQFQVMLAFILPIAHLVPHLQPQAPAMLLPVRLCSVLRTWAADIPSDALMPVLQLLQAFLSAESPKAVRLAALSPLRVMLERFSDHEAWTQVQGQLIDSSLALLSMVTSPEVQWRCLNLVNLFLVEEAESGRYQVTERTMQQLLELWRRPEEGEFLIRHALLDVLRALVLMSCRSRSPRLALSPPLLSCCLTVISDCYAVHRGGNSSGSKGGYEAGAALQADAEAAAGALGDHGSASGSLFDSGSVLFLGVLRTVDIQQAVPLMPFFPQLLQQQASLPGPPAEWTMDILLEYCALHCSGGASGHLLQFYPALLKICQSQLSEAKASRSTEMSLQLLQLLLAHAPNVEALQQTKEVIVPLFQSWVTTFDPWATKSNFALPITTFLGLLGAWHACHPNDFTEHCLRFTEQAASCGLQVPKLSVLLAACCKQARSVALRSSVMSAALALAPNGVEEAFWREIMNGCNELILAANKRGISSALAKTLQSLKSSLSAKLPAPARSAAELQLCLLPKEMRQSSALQEDGSIEDATIARWLFSRMAVWLKQLGASRHEQLQALLAAAPEQVREALRNSGL